MIQKVLPRLAVILALLLGGSALAQTTAAQRQFARLDFGVSGAGQFNGTVSGIVGPVASDQGSSITQQGSNTLGALVTLRYIAKPYIGFEGNIGYARYTENFSGPGIAEITQGSLFQVQTDALEYTLGYVVTPAHPIFGLQPFASVGAGSIEFKPTPHGGAGEPRQARAAYYYNVGLQQEFANSHFGLRASFRQVFFNAPDFGQNYLTIVKHTYTIEPTAGVFLRF